jgi:predicted lipoprotein with Yx(FWY)xxD motif
MRRPRIIASTLAVAAAAVVALTIAVSGGSASKVKPTPLNAGSALSVAHTAVGKVLVDANGRTLYLFEGDRRNHSTLSHAGFAVWPAFTSAGTPQAKNGVSAAHIAVIKSDGKRQVTYYGHPLYYYVGDKTSGETHGQGLTEFGALWYVLSPTGTAVTSVPSAPAATTTESPAYGY